jgi:hypothetical protein
VTLGLWGTLSQGVWSQADGNPHVSTPTVVRELRFFAHMQKVGHIRPVCKFLYECAKPYIFKNLAKLFFANLYHSVFISYWPVGGRLEKEYRTCKNLRTIIVKKAIHCKKRLATFPSPGMSA